MICNYLKDIYENYIHSSLIDVEIQYSKLVFDLVNNYINENIVHRATMNKYVEIEKAAYYFNAIAHFRELGFDWYYNIHGMFYRILNKKYGL